MGRSSRRNRAPRTQRSLKAGMPPGVPVYVGAERSDPIHVAVLDYDHTHFLEVNSCTEVDLANLAQANTVTWVNVDGMHDPGLVERICQAFHVHPLWMEDLLNAASRPKAEWMQGQLLVMMRTVEVVENGDVTFESEQNGFVLGPGWVLAFQERAGDPWAPLRERLRSGTSTLRRGHADALLHALIDAVVDQYFIAIERLEGMADELEDRALTGTASEVPARFLAIKQDLAVIRAAVLPLRDAIGTILRGEDAILSAESRPLWQDLTDHVAQAHEATEALRERLVVALELHLAMTNHQLNDVMRLLTLVSTIFIPLTFIVGVYGMNFQHMPELELWWGYPGVWAVMGIIATGILAYYRRHGWL